jgi:hypothetical protein
VHGERVKDKRTTPQTKGRGAGAERQSGRGMLAARGGRGQRDSQAGGMLPMQAGLAGSHLWHIIFSGLFIATTEFIQPSNCGVNGAS